MNDLENRFRYESWANRRLLAHLKAIPDLEQGVVRLFAHVQVGLKVWGLRIDGQDSRDEAIWPHLSLDACEELLAENEATYARLLAPIEDDSPEREVAYTNQHGLSYVTALGDILTHLLLHGAHHRGQIAMRLRQEGKEPINTDYITYVRELAGQEWRP